MKFLKKIIIGSLIMTLTSFVGGVCMHPLSAQAATSSDMMTVHADGQDAVDASHTMLMDDTVSLSIGACISDCVSKTPQATVAKKAAVDSTLSLSLAIFQTEPFVPVCISDTFGAVGTHPPSPDILSSVVKIE